MADGTVKIDVILNDDQVKGGVKNVEGGLKGIANSAKSGVGTVAKLAGALGLVALASKGIDMVKQSIDGAIDRYDTLNNFPRVMEQIGFDAETSQGAINKLSDGIQGLPTRLDEVASTAQSIAIMTGDLDGAVDTTLALNNAFLASGASTADAERGLQQYTQMLAKGEVDLQSWRTLQETMPFALRETAEAFGFTGQSATNDFYEALKEGDITMDEFNAKLIELDTAQGGFAETAKSASAGIKTAWTNMQTWVVMGVAKIISAIDEALGGVGSIEGAINALEPIFDSVFTFIADAIIKTGDVVRDLRERFNSFRESIQPIVANMQPLLDIFRQTGDNLKGSFTPIWENLKTLFNSLMPIIEKIAMVLGGVLLAAIVVVTSVLNGLLNAIGPIINAFINLVDVVVNVVNAIIAVLMGDFTAALEFWNQAADSSVQFFMNLFDGIVGFVMGIVDAVVGWFEFLYMTLVGNSIIPDMVDAIIEWFNNLFDWLIDIVMAIVDGVIDFFTTLYDKGVEIFESFSNFISDIWSYIEDTFKNALDFILALVTGDFEGMKQAMQNQMENAKNLLSNIWSNIKSIIGERLSSILSDLISKFSEMVSNTRAKASEILSAVRDKFTEVVSAVREKLTEAVSTVGTKISEMPGKVIEFTGQMMSAGAGLITGLISGIRNMTGSAIEAITGVVGGVIDKAKSLLKINSPSKLFEQFGEWTSEGLSIGIDDGSKDAIKSMSDLTKGVVKEAELDLLADIKGFTANKLLSNSLPTKTNSKTHDKNVTENKYNNVNFDGLFNGANFHVRDEQDIPRLAKELNDYIKRQARKGGVVM